MGFIADPNAGPSRGRMAETGVLIDAAKENNVDPAGDVTPLTPLAASVVFVTRSLVSRPLSTGLTINIRCDQNGSYTIRGVDLKGKIYTLQDATAYTASSGVVPVTFSRFVHEAYVEFTPSAPASDLYVEAFSYGRGF